MERIGLGGMAEVFRAQAIDGAGTRRTVVVKKILPSYSDDPDFRQMFVDETRIVASLDHPNIVKLVDLGRMDDQLFIALEYIDGADVDQLLYLAREQDVRIPVAAALQITAEVLRGLHHAHTRTRADGLPLEVVHRDLTPANVLLARDGSVKLADFGIAKAATRGTRTSVGTVKGNALYVAPEQLLGQHVDHRADVYAAGNLLHTLLRGRHPMDGFKLTEVMDRLKTGQLPKPETGTPAVDAMIARATEHEPERRFTSALEFRMTLEDAAARLAIPLARGSVAALFGRIRGLAPVSVEPVPASRRTSGIDRLEALIASESTGEGSVFVTKDWPEFPSPPPRRVENLPSSVQEGSLMGHSQAVAAVLVDAQATTGFSAGHDQAVLCWNLRQRAERRSFPGHRAAVTSLAADGRGTVLCSASRDRTVRVWNVETGECTAVLAGHGGWVFSVAVSADGTRALSGSVDRTARLWNLQTKEPLSSMTGHGDAVSSVTFAPEARALTGSYDGTLRLWDLDSGREVRAFSGGIDAIRAVAVTPSGLVLGASADSFIHLWDLGSAATESSRLAGHQAPVVSLALSADHLRAVSAGHDGAIVLWDLETRSPLNTVRAPVPVLCVTFAGSDRRVLAGCADGSLALLDVGPA